MFTNIMTVGKYITLLWKTYKMTEYKLASTKKIIFIDTIDWV